jgi:drug/metabolite transporter (DMT)-like permease
MGALYLAGYIATIGVATFLLKYVSDDLSPYQINFLMALGMVVIGVPAVLIAHRTLALPRASLPLGTTVGALMAAGSILYVLAISKLPVGLASAIATSYIVVVVVLSRLVLDESLSLPKIIGLALTIAGVALLSYVS